jgi:hypothetical protein
MSQRPSCCTTSSWYRGRIVFAKFYAIHDPALDGSLADLSSGRDGYVAIHPPSQLTGVA